MDTLHIATILASIILLVALIATAFYYRSARAEAIASMQTQCSKDIAALNNDLTRSLKDIDMLSRLSPELRSQLEAQKAALVKLQADLEEERAKCNDKVSSVKAAVDTSALESKISSLQKEFNISNKERMELIEERDMLKEQLNLAKDTDETKAAELQSSLNKCTSELRAVNNNFNECKTKLEDALELVKKLQNKEQTSSTTIADLTNSLAAARERAGVLQNNLDEKTATVTTAQTSVASLRNSLSSLDEKEAAITALNAKVQEITGKYNEVKDTSAALQNNIAKIFSDFKMRGGNYNSQWDDAKYLNLFRRVPGSEISGSDIGNWSDPINFGYTSPEACAARCIKDKNCAAFTFDQNWPSPYKAGEKGYCALKTTRNISGTMSGRDVFIL